MQRIALCPGAGATVIGTAPADVYLTGEMRHHDVLEAVAGGTSVILTNHTHTERGYLEVLARRLTAAFGGKVEVDVSRCDRDPLRFA